MAHFSNDDVVINILGVRKAFTRTLPERNPRYTVRESQLMMAEHVVQNFVDQTHLLLEAKTGVGKSNGYLIPILLNIDTSEKMPIIISTATKILQDQLARDLPRLISDLGLEDIKYSVLKGKNNYLCPHKYESAYAKGKIHSHMYKQCKDGKEIEDLKIPEQMMDKVYLVNADDDCLGRGCPKYKKCPMITARREAQSANLVITNHHLVMFAARFPNANILPEYQYIVFDEGHTMPSIMSSVYTRTISQNNVKKLIEETQDLISHSMSVTYIKSLLENLEDLSEKFFNHVRPKSLVRIEGMNMYPEFPFLVDRMYFDVNGAKEMAQICNDIVKDAKGETNRLINLFLGSSPNETDDESVHIAMKLTNRFLTLQKDLEFVSKLHNHFALWAEVKNSKKWKSTPYITLNYTPIDVGPLYQSIFVATNKSVLVTSATLGVGGKPTYFKSLLGFKENDDTVFFESLDSPFDYDNNVRVYLPEGIPSPNDEEYFNRASDEMVKLINLTQGRTLILCTSISATKKFYEELSKKIPYKCLLQGNLSMSETIHQFKTDEHSVLIGTKSFWEGVDIPGMALSSIIIDKLPFPNQGDPIVKATCEYYESKMRNAFKAFSIPEAVMLFKQGVGRLIRSESDFGIMTILDARMQNASYADYFVEALPTKNIVGNFDELGNWWNERMTQSVFQ